MEIRRAEAQDVSVIRQLAFDTWPVCYKDIISPEQIAYMLEKMYSISELTHQLADLDYRFIIAYEGERPVGFAGFSHKVEGATVYRLHKLYVLPDQQGKGTGKLLIDTILQEIKPLGATELELNVNKQNPALHFYRKLGFTMAREEKIDIGGGFWMDDFVMRRLIP